MTGPAGSDYEATSGVDPILLLPARMPSAPHEGDTMEAVVEGRRMTFVVTATRWDHDGRLLIKGHWLAPSKPSATIKP